MSLERSNNGAGLIPEPHSFPACRLGAWGVSCFTPPGYLLLHWSALHQNYAGNKSNYQRIMCGFVSPFSNWFPIEMP